MKHYTRSHLITEEQPTQAVTQPGHTETACQKLSAFGHAWWLNQKFFPPDPDGVLEQLLATAKPGAKTSHARIIRALLPQTNFRVIIKWDSPRGWAFRLKDIFRRSRSFRVFKQSLELMDRGVRVPLPVAVAEERSGIWLRRSFFVSEDVSGPTLRECAQTESGLVRRRIVKKFARTIASLHNHGWAHTDLHLGNFILASGPTAEVVLIDLDAVRRVFLVSRKRAAKDLNRFLQRPAVPQRDRLLFLAAYCEARNPPENPRTFLRLLGSVPPAKLLPLDRTSSPAPVRPRR